MRERKRSLNLNLNLKCRKVIKLGNQGVARQKSLNLNYKGEKLIKIKSVNQGLGRQKSLYFNLKGRKFARCASWTATAFSFAIPSTTSFPVTPECPPTQASSIGHISLADTSSLIASSTSWLVGFREKMDCRAGGLRVCPQLYLYPF